jgi:CRISPR system Cascade subunit CasD
VDYHTVQGTRKATGKIKDCQPTPRHYLYDSDFRVFLSGESALLREAGNALLNPVWGLWLGRKCCLPSAPVFAGLFADEAAALEAVLGAPLEEFTHEREVRSFDEGSDSLPDQALSFLSSGRQFAPRRVLHRIGKEPRLDVTG